MLRGAARVEIDGDGDLGLLGVAHDLRAARGRRVSRDAEGGERGLILGVGADA